MKQAAAPCTNNSTLATVSESCTPAMYIGKLAKLTGATPKAIRLYESMGLITAPSRKGQYRIYTSRDVAIISMIRRAQTVGFNLAELKNLVSLKARNHQFPLELANELIAKKREDFHCEMKRIAALDQQLVALQEELKLSFANKRATE